MHTSALRERGIVSGSTIRLDRSFVSPRALKHIVDAFRATLREAEALLDLLGLRSPERKSASQLRAAARAAFTHVAALEVDLVLPLLWLGRDVVVVDEAVLLGELQAALLDVCQRKKEIIRRSPQEPLAGTVNVPTAMTRAAPRPFAAAAVRRPTGPAPKTTTFEAGFMAATLATACTPTDIGSSCGRSSSSVPR